MYRIEKDSLGEKQIPSEALYGIHSVRARENFPGNSPFPVEWYKAVGITKLACYNTYRKFRIAAESKSGKDLPFKSLSLYRQITKYYFHLFYCDHRMGIFPGGSNS